VVTDPLSEIDVGSENEEKSECARAVDSMSDGRTGDSESDESNAESTSDNSEEIKCQDKLQRWQARCLTLNMAERGGI
jgi:hypothetical protein